MELKRPGNGPFQLMAAPGSADCTRKTDPPMIVDLFKGLIKDASGAELEAWCARTPFGIRAVAIGGPHVVRIVEPDLTAVAEHITSLDLPGLDRESLEFLTDAILQGSYLEKPGVRGKGDAVLFMLTNDALHALDQAASRELEEEEAS